MGKIKKKLTHSEYHQYTQFFEEIYEAGVKRKIKCENCKFWDKPHTGSGKHPITGEPLKTGACKRYPPKFNYGVHKFILKKRLEPIHFSCWPITIQYDWCGEWQEKEKSKKGAL